MNRRVEVLLKSDPGGVLKKLEEMSAPRVGLSGVRSWIEGPRLYRGKGASFKIAMSHAIKDGALEPVDFVFEGDLLPEGRGTKVTGALRLGNAQKLLTGLIASLLLMGVVAAYLDGQWEAAIVLLVLLSAAAVILIVRKNKLLPTMEESLVELLRSLDK